MNKFTLKACLIVLGLAVAVPVPALADAGAGGAKAVPLTDPAAKQIRSFYDALLDSMKHAKALGVKGRYKKLQQLSMPASTSRQ